MSKSKHIFCCSSCGYETPKWLGKCPSCSEWNTFSEVSIKKIGKSASGSLKILSGSNPELLSAVAYEESARISTGISEWDRVLGKINAGQAILLSGEPGIGKSTLLMQIAETLAKQGSIFYINGEESSSQVKQRADRLKIQSDTLYLFSETNIEYIIQKIQEYNPTCIIIDSLQTLSSDSIESSPGSLPQLRECTHQIVNACKSMNIISLLVSHVTKEGSIAGPKAIEHLVDTVLFLESDARGIYRVLRSFKNRFASTNEAGFFEMGEYGLYPSEDLSTAFISIHEYPVFGSAVYVHSEGQRIFPLEVQALCHHNNQNYPRRTAEGIDNNKLALISAVLEKQLKIPLSKFDIYANITSGLEIKDRAIDLSLIAAIYSSFKETALDNSSVFIGEIGLSGEIRPVKDIQKRVKESARLGIQKIFIPYDTKHNAELKNFPIKPLKHISELAKTI
ncbi:MAG: DNA repair protein RadA [Brevinemataceae bacterium]